jgi:hypothetical protein
MGNDVRVVDEALKARQAADWATKKKRPPNAELEPDGM